MREDGGIRGASLHGPLLALALVLAAALAIRGQGPPAPRPADTPETEFSAARAMEHVRVIARKAHPTGSAANDRVRDHLLETLRGLGLDPRTEPFVRLLARDGTLLRVRGVDVLARVPGRDPTGALLLMAHYDARHPAPGAGDDASGTAALLETLRALRAELPLRNDLILLLTDGEEIGLLGARVFVDGHPWMEDVSVVLNLEARGSAGPALMFETGPGNGRVVEWFAEAAPRPVSSSLYEEVYRRLPNDTDLTPFREAGRVGLNFAFVGGAEAYHTPLDVPERLSPASLQHQGDQALALARRIGDADLSAPRAPDRVFFSLPWAGLLHYPAALAPWLAGGLGLAWVGVLLLGLRGGRVGVRGLVAGALAGAVVVALAAGAGWGLWRLAAAVETPAPGGPRALWGEAVYLGSAVALAAALLFGLFGLLRRWFPAPALALGALLHPIALALLTGLRLPGGSHLPLWPAASALVATAWVLIRSGPEMGGRRTRDASVGAEPEGPGRSGGGPPDGGRALPGGGALDAAVLGILVLPALALGAPFLTQMLDVLSSPALPVLAGAAAFFLLAALPALDVLGRPARPWLPALAGVAAVALLVVGAADRGPDASHPAAAPLVHHTLRESPEGGEGGGDTPGVPAAARGAWLTASREPAAWLASLTRPPTDSARLPRLLHGTGAGTATYRGRPAPPAEASPVRLRRLGRVGEDGEASASRAAGGPVSGDGRPAGDRVLRLSLEAAGGGSGPDGGLVAVEVSPVTPGLRLLAVGGEPPPAGPSAGGEGTDATDRSDATGRPAAGRPAPPAWTFRQLGRPEAPLELRIGVPAGGPAVLRLVSYLDGLPPSREGSPLRPAGLVGDGGADGRPVLTDLTIVEETRAFPLRP